MNIEELFNDKNKLEKKYNFFINKKQIIRIEPDNDLVLAHLEKAKHNMLFFDKNKKDETFRDWLIVTLYYALYHAVLALIVNKNYVSKNHTASLIFLIKHYAHLKEDIELFQELSIKKEDAELYTELKEERHKASYETNLSFSKEKIIDYKTRVVQFIHETWEIIEKDN